MHPCKMYEKLPPVNTEEKAEESNAPKMATTSTSMTPTQFKDGMDSELK